ncbi:MAG: response regulator transcription factor [Peptococcaceae bacterium]|jgi:DNA-binding response OmpR family regulator|nr:response regulator transcription factor [Peptococcaceae bacterium]
MSKIPLILICDDQPIIHETLGVYLKSEGYAYTSAFDGEEALKKANSDYPDLIVLDLMMPKMSGVDVCLEIRKTSAVPIIMLTAKTEEIDRVLGLEIGADDYIVKPFSPREVVARIKAVLRRSGDQKESPTATPILRFDDLEINLNNYEVRIEGASVQFTPKEVEILYLLASHPGQVYDREQILSQVWGYDYFGDTRVVDTQIKRIRQKLPPEGYPWSIRTIYGVGYKFEVSP